jgi:hypothetical protein
VNRITAKFAITVMMGLPLLGWYPMRPALAWCLFHCGPDLTGKWVSFPNTPGRVYMNISQSGDTYVVKILNPDGLLNGAFSGPYKDGLIMIGTVVGNIEVQVNPDGTVLLSIGGVLLHRTN